MSVTRRSRAAAFGAALCIHIWPLAGVALAAFTPACSLLLKNANTPVADGKLYEPGEEEYDAFFKELYETQVLMGQAPEREAQARARVAKALNLAESSSSDAVGDALYERAAVLAKAGVMVKLSLAGIDEPGEASATVVTIGDLKDEKDVKLVEALDEAVKADAALLEDLRKARKPLDRMRGKAASLEPRIETAFAKNKSKKAEVRRNLDDARQLIPLMAERGEDIHRQSAHFLTALQKVLGAPTSPGGPTEPDAEPAKKGKPGKQKAAPAKPVSKPVPPPRAVPKAEPKEPTPPSAKKAPVEAKKPVAKAPAEDFEP